MPIRRLRDTGIAIASTPRRKRAYSAYASTRSVLLDGTAEYVNVDAALTPVASDTQGTMSCWVKPVDATPAALSDLVAFSDTSGQDRVEIGIEVTNGKFRCFAYDGGPQWFLLTDANPFSDGVWTHCAVTQNGSDPVLYIDGAAPAQTFSVQTDKTLWFGSSANIDNGRIGCRNINSAGNTKFFNGNVSHVSIWNVALSATEIKEIYGVGRPGDLAKHSRRSALKAWFPLGDSPDSSAIAYDIIGLNHGTPVAVEDADFEVDAP